MVLWHKMVFLDSLLKLIVSLDIPIQQNCFIIMDSQQE
jgi:hypothetical protein